jgi:hypothetical protein|tara:strand:- start:107 stop:313 length:207 start_codon:yes stop_codon:yes gene_type:complete
MGDAEVFSTPGDGAVYVLFSITLIPIHPPLLTGKSGANSDVSTKTVPAYYLINQLDNVGNSAKRTKTI